MIININYVIYIILEINNILSMEIYLIFILILIIGLILFFVYFFFCYRDSIDFAQRQLCIAEELDSPNMRAEAYLNLARAHERLGALERALAYARHR